MKKNILFVINNLSGTVSQFNIPKYIEIYLDLDIYEYRYFSIDQNSEDEKLIQHLNEKWEIIISVGGDGTLLELGQKLIDKDVILGIIPIGSGNGLATHLGYKPRNIELAFEAINTLNLKSIDIASINDSYFFSNFGMGIDAKIAKDFKLKKVRSLWVYTYLTLKRFWSLKAKKIQYITNGETHTVKTYLFNVFNSNLFGYNVGLIPWASAFDGELDVAYVKSVPKIFLPWINFCILIKKPNWTSSIVYFKTKEITIVNFKVKKMGYQIDGDPKRSKKEDLVIKVLPSKLKMIVP